MRLVLLLTCCALAFPAEARRKRKPSGDACPTECAGPRLYEKAPAAAAADRELLALCAKYESADEVPEPELRTFFESQLGDRRLAEAVRAVAPFAKARADQAEFLASIWSGPARRNAVTHVLCGDDWSTGKLGGLHLESRYAQLEREGKLCYGGPARGREACRRGLCTIRYAGVKGFSCGRKEVGGFAQGMDAVELLATGTRAYGACCMGGAPIWAYERSDQQRDGGRYQGPRGLTFQIWCGARNGRSGIATLYPIEGKPNCGP